MRLRLLKLCCLLLVVGLAGGLIVFEFSGDDLRSAFIQTSSVTPAMGIDTSSVPAPTHAAASSAPTADATAPAASADNAPGEQLVQTPSGIDGQSAVATAPSASTDQSQTPPAPNPASDETPAAAPVESVEAAPVPLAPSAPAANAAAAPTSEPMTVKAFASQATAFPATIGPADAVRASTEKTPKSPSPARKNATASNDAVPPSQAQAAQPQAANPTAFQIAAAANPPPSTELIAQTPPAPASAPLSSAEGRSASGSLSSFPKIAFGPQLVVEFPTIQTNASGTVTGTGSVTNSTARIIPGIAGSWTSAPLNSLPLNPSFGGSLFVGVPASGDSVTSTTTSSGYALKLGQTNNWPVIMPSFFMGVPVTNGTSASFGTGVWVNNVKETATLSNSSFSESDARSGMTVRPFLNAAIVQRLPLVGFLPGDQQELKLSGGYVFGDTNFQSSACGAGQSCLKTSDQGGWFLGLSFQFGFPVGGAPGR